jgi:hypothetical protein
MLICAVGLAWTVTQRDSARSELMAINELELDAFA